MSLNVCPGQPERVVVLYAANKSEAVSAAFLSAYLENDFSESRKQKEQSQLQWLIW